MSFKFGVDTFNTFRIIGFHDYDDLAITIVRLFLRNRQAKNVKIAVSVWWSDLVTVFIPFVAAAAIVLVIVVFIPP